MQHLQQREVHEHAWAFMHVGACEVNTSVHAALRTVFDTDRQHILAMYLSLGIAAFAPTHEVVRIHPCELAYGIADYGVRLDTNCFSSAV